MIAEYDGDDALQAKYILGRRIDEPLVMERRDIADIDGDQDTTEFQSFHYHTNHLGTIAALTWWDDTNAQEKLIERCQYDARLAPRGRIVKVQTSGHGLPEMALGALWGLKSSIWADPIRTP